LRIQQCEDLKSIEGIAMTSASIHDLSDISQDYDRFNSTNIPQFGLSITDLSGFKTISPQLFAVDPSYYQTIINDYIQMQEGDAKTAFDKLSENNSFNVLISNEIAKQLFLHLNDFIQVQFQRNNDQIQVLAHIVGIYQRMPGAYYATDLLEFKSMMGIIIDLNKLTNYLGLTSGIDNFIDQIHIRLQSQADPNIVEQKIEEYFGIYAPYVKITLMVNQLSADQEKASLAEIIMITITSLIVLMVLQGFGISAYTMFLERRYEIQMYRAMGLSIRDIKRMLFWELLLILLGSGILAIGIGWGGALGFGNVIEFLFNIGGSQSPPVEIIGIIFIGGVIFLYFQFQYIFAKRISPNLISPYQLLR
jgi:ABC-type antimicrobial peptide transport system permease subunit